jgi:hypothetical protein
MRIIQGWYGGVLERASFYTDINICIQQHEQVEEQERHEQEQPALQQALEHLRFRSKLVFLSLSLYVCLSLSFSVSLSPSVSV